jgi:predicted membrane protein
METFENNKHFKRHCHDNGRSHYHLLGIVLIVVGAALILKNMGIFPYCIKNIIFSWQMLLVTIGLVITLGSSNDRTGGIIAMVVGAFFLIPKIFRVTFDINIFWPMIFIVVGLIFIFSRGCRIKGHSKAKIGDDFLDIANIFSGSDKKIMSENFSGGKITAIFGGSEIDFTQTKLAYGTSELEVTCVFGGIVLTVPSDWDVKVNVTSVFGGVDERQLISGKFVDTSKQLIIKGTAVFGGVELKRY